MHVQLLENKSSERTKKGKKRSILEADLQDVDVFRGRQRSYKAFKPSKKTSLDVTWQRLQSVNNASEFHPLQRFPVCALRALGLIQRALVGRAREVGERHLCAFPVASWRVSLELVMGGGVCGLA